MTKHFLGYSSRHYWCPAHIPLALTIPVCKDGISLQVRATLCFGLLPMAIISWAHFRLQRILKCHKLIMLEAVLS